MNELAGCADPIRRRANAVEALYAAGHRLLSRDRFEDAASVCRAMLTFAPRDERGWLALAACHEGLGQPDVALQLYAVGCALVRDGGVRCDLARARLFRALGRIHEADEVMGLARARALVADDPYVWALVRAEEVPS